MTWSSQSRVTRTVKCRVEMSMRRDGVPRSAVLANFTAYQPRRMTFKSVKPRQRRVPRGRSSEEESLQNKEIFRKSLSKITTVVFRV